jgi:hypothetical protein
MGLLPPTAAWAQGSPSLGSDGMVGAEARMGPGLTQLRGSVVPVARGMLALDLSSWFSLGGEAVLPLSEVRAAGPASPDRSELTLRYGGLRLALRRPDLGEADPWRLSLLLGTGTARVHSTLLDTELASDNFVVLEPALERRIGEFGPFLVDGLAAYRLPLGAENLPGVRASELGGASIAVTVSLVRNP